MSYDLYVLRVDPGVTWREVLERRAAEPDWPLQDLADDHVRIWGRIVRRVRAEIGAAEVERLPTYAMLAVDEPTARVRFEQDAAVIEIPYGYAGPQARTALLRGYALARAIGGETGWLAIDPIVDRVIPADDEAAELR